MALKAKFLHFTTKAAYENERKRNADAGTLNEFQGYLSFVDEGPTIYTRGCEYDCSKHTNIFESLVIGSETTGLVVEELDGGPNIYSSSDISIDSPSIYCSDVYVDNLAINDGKSTQFLKADGSLDSTAYASTTYVDNKVADLVNSAPETLNTLNELATALGNDANFATSVTNKLGEKANSTDLDNYLPKTEPAVAIKSYYNHISGDNDTSTKWIELGTIASAHSQTDLTTAPSTYGVLFSGVSKTSSGGEIGQLWLGQTGKSMYRRSGNHTGWWTPYTGATPWIEMIDTLNLSNHTVPKTGGTFTGNVTFDGVTTKTKNINIESGYGIYFNRTDTNYMNIPNGDYSSIAISQGGMEGSKILYEFCKDSIKPYETASKDLGGLHNEWNHLYVRSVGKSPYTGLDFSSAGYINPTSSTGIYLGRDDKAFEEVTSKKFKTVGGTSNQVVLGDGTLKNIDELGSGNSALYPLASISAVDLAAELDDVETLTFVKFVSQSLSDSQKQQARQNIGAVDADYVESRLGDINSILESIINS